MPVANGQGPVPPGQTPAHRPPAQDATAPGTARSGRAEAVDELARRREAAEAMGGEQALARHRASGRMPVRERVAALVDPGTWFEIGALAEPEIRREKPVPGDAVVTGFGTLDGRRVGVIGIDATAVAGTTAPISMRKQGRLIEHAQHGGFPLVLLCDADGGRMPDVMGWRFSGLPLDVTSTSDALIVEAAMPGIRPEDVEITVENGTLSIRGESRQERREGEGESLVQEIRRSSVSRTVSLPSGIEADKATAAFENGMLTLRIPKAEAVKPRQIRITPTVEGSAKGSDAKPLAATGNGSRSEPVTTGQKG